jgi:hypothetical protein
MDISQNYGDLFGDHFIFKSGDSIGMLNETVSPSRMNDRKNEATVDDSTQQKMTDVHIYNKPATSPHVEMDQDNR